MFLCLIQTDLHSVVYDTIVAAAGKTIEEVIIILEEESKLAIEWFKKNRKSVTTYAFPCLRAQTSPILEHPVRFTGHKSCNSGNIIF